MFQPGFSIDTGQAFVPLIFLIANKRYSPRKLNLTQSSEKSKQNTHFKVIKLYIHSWQQSQQFHKERDKTPV